MKRTTIALTIVLIVIGGPTVADPVALEPAVSISLGTLAEWVTTLDLDGDGILDVVRTDADGRGMTPLINQGDAAFDTYPKVLAGYRSFRPAVAGDVDSDGDPDLVVGMVHYVGDTSQIDENVLVLLVNDGSGNLSASVLATDCHAWTEWSVIDLDADGDLDIAYGKLYEDDTQELGLLVNDGDGHFTTGPAISLSAEPDDTIEYTAAFGDLGTDGLPELFVVLRESGPMLLTNEGALKFSPPNRIEGGGGDAVFADVTGDGFNDLVASWDGRVEVWTGTGTDSVGSYSEYSEYGVSTYRTGYRPICVDDFDADGDLDVAIPPRSGHVAVLANSGDGRFEKIHQYDLVHPGEVGSRWYAYGHFDADGTKELFVHFHAGARLLSPGGVAPPTILRIEPEQLQGGRTHELTVHGAGFTEGMTLDIEEWVDVHDLRVDSPEILTATVAVGHWDIDHPVDVPDDEFFRFNVILRGPTGGSSRIPYGLAVPPYWTIRLGRVDGTLKVSEKAGRDKFKAEGTIVHAEVLDFFAQAGQDCRLVIGNKEQTWETTIPGDDPGWRLKTKKGEIQRMIYRSRPGATPRIKLIIRPEPTSRSWRISVKRVEFPAVKQGDLRIELHMGEIRAASVEPWVFRKRPDRLEH